MTETVTVPTHIKRRVESSGAGTGLELAWSDGRESFISSTALRTNCPCADCAAQRKKTPAAPVLPVGKSALKVLAASADEQTNLSAVWAIGAYAIGIRWADGHDTGIYPYELLRNLSPE